MIAIDIEAIPNESAIQSEAWAKHKERHQIEDDSRAALHPAFAQTVCVCAFDTIRKKQFSMCTGNEMELLSKTSEFIESCAKDFFTDYDKIVLGGHNIKGYDIPVLAFGMMSHGIKIPDSLRVAGKKPWEIPHIDTAELLRFGGGPYVSLDAICLRLGITSPKDGPVVGATVWKAFKDGQYDEIEKYCGRDVNAWLKVYKRLLNMGVIL